MVSGNGAQSGAIVQCGYPGRVLAGRRGGRRTLLSAMALQWASRPVSVNRVGTSGDWTDQMSFEQADVLAIWRSTALVA